MLNGGGADKVEQMEWHDSVNFVVVTKALVSKGVPFERPATDGDNLAAVFCIANEGTDEYNQQCVCENNDPMEHLPEVCSKMGTNVVTIEWVKIPECHSKDAKLPFCDLPELYMTERESDLTIALQTKPRRLTPTAYRKQSTVVVIAKDGISPYYVIMEGNKSREVFFNDITQEPSTQYDSQYNEMNESKIVNNSLFQVPIRVERSQIDFKMPQNITTVLQKEEDGDIICGEECANVCADTCGGGGCPNTMLQCFHLPHNQVYAATIQALVVGGAQYIIVGSNIGMHGGVGMMGMVGATMDQSIILGIPTKNSSFSINFNLETLIQRVAK